MLKDDLQTKSAVTVVEETEAAGARGVVERYKARKKGQVRDGAGYEVGDDLKVPGYRVA